jgi:hypothetical protein
MYGYEPWDFSITKVDNNKAYINDSFFANIQIGKIKDGDYMFADCSQLTLFDDNLPNL